MHCVQAWYMLRKFCLSVRLWHLTLVICVKTTSKINTIAFQSKADNPRVCIYLRSYDLDLTPWPSYLTLAYTLWSCICKPKMKFVGHGFQKLERDQDRQTHRHTRLKILPRHHWRRHKFSFGSCSRGGLRKGIPHWGLPAKPRYGVFVPQMMKHFKCNIVYIFLLQKRSKFETVGLIDTLILDQSVSWWGAKRHFAGA